MCIRDRGITVEVFKAGDGGEALNKAILSKDAPLADVFYGCLLYTSDAADARSSVDLGGRRIIKKKKRRNGGDSATEKTEM